MSINEQFEQARVLHQQGKLGEAEHIYQAILKQDKNHNQSLHFLGVLYYQKQQYDKALTLLNQAVILTPDNYDYQSNLGAVYFALGQMEKAKKCFTKATKINPKKAPAYCNLGVIYYHANQYDKAKTYYKKAIACDANYAIAYYQYSIQCMDLRQFGEAIDALNKAIACAPNVPAYYEILGRAYEQDNQYDKAEQILQKALKLDPNYVIAMNSLASVYANLGKLDTAITWYRKAISAKPDYIKAYYQILLLDSHSLNQQDIQKLSSLLQSSLPTDDMCFLHLTLAKIYEKQGQYEQAFTHYVKSNEIKRASLEFDIKGNERYVKHLIKVYDKKLFAKKKNQGFADKGPIFIISMPRSGSTLLEQMLACHSQITGAGELHTLYDVLDDFDHKINIVDTITKLLPKLPSQDYQALGEAYFIKTKQYQQTPFFTDKMPFNFFLVGTIKLIMPHAKIIHIKRDPLDCCWSCFKTNFAFGNEFSYSLDDVAYFYQLYQKLMAHWHEVLPGNILDVEYQALVEQPQEQLTRVLHHCQLEYEPACLDFTKNKRPVRTASRQQIRKPLSRVGIGTWRPYEAYLQSWLKALR